MLKLILLIVSLGMIQNSMALNYRQFVDLVLNKIEQEQVLKEAHINIKIKEIEKNYSLKKYADWQLSFTLGTDYQYIDNDRYTNTTRAYDKKQVGTNHGVKLDINKRFLNNPSHLKLSGGKRKNDFGVERYQQRHHTLSHYPHSFEDYLNFNWQYPLLKHNSTNAGSLKAYYRNILDLEKQKLIFYEEKEDFLVDRLKEYLTWFLHQYTANTLHQYLQSLAAIKPSNKQEIKQLKSTIYRIKNQQSNHFNEMRRTQQSLSVRLNHDFSQQVLQLNLNYSPTLVDNLNTFLPQYSRELAKKHIDKLLKQIDIDFHKNQNQPSLNFSVNIDKTLSDNKTQTTHYDNNKIAYKFALYFSYPIFGHATTQSDLAISVLNLEKLRLSYADKLQDLSVDLSALSINILDRYRLLKSRLKLVKIAQDNTKIQWQAWQHKKISLKDYLDALSDDHTTKIDYIEAVIDDRLEALTYDNLLDRIIIYQPNLVSLNAK